MASLHKYLFNEAGGATDAIDTGTPGGSNGAYVNSPNIGSVDSGAYGMTPVTCLRPAYASDGSAPTKYATIPGAVVQITPGVDKSVTFRMQYNAANTPTETINVPGAYSNSGGSFGCMNGTSASGTSNRTKVDNVNIWHKPHMYVISFGYQTLSVVMRNGVASSSSNFDANAVVAKITDSSGPSLFGKWYDGVGRYLTIRYRAASGGTLDIGLNGVYGTAVTGVDAILFPGGGNDQVCTTFGLSTVLGNGVFSDSNNLSDPTFPYGVAGWCRFPFDISLVEVEDGTPDIQAKTDAFDGNTNESVEGEDALRTVLGWGRTGPLIWLHMGDSKMHRTYTSVTADGRDIGNMLEAKLMLMAAYGQGFAGLIMGGSFPNNGPWLGVSCGLVNGGLDANNTVVGDYPQPTHVRNHGLAYWSDQITGISTSSGGYVTVTTRQPHGLLAGEDVTHLQTDSTPVIDGTYAVHDVPSSTTYRIPNPDAGAVTVAGTTGLSFQGSASGQFWLDSQYLGDGETMTRTASGVVFNTTDQDWPFDDDADFLCATFPCGFASVGGRAYPNFKIGSTLYPPSPVAFDALTGSDAWLTDPITVDVGTDLNGTSGSFSLAKDDGAGVATGPFAASTIGIFDQNKTTGIVYCPMYWAATNIYRHAKDLCDTPLQALADHLYQLTWYQRLLGKTPRILLEQEWMAHEAAEAQNSIVYDRNTGLYTIDTTNKTNSVTGAKQCAQAIRDRLLDAWVLAGFDEDDFAVGYNFYHDNTDVEVQGRHIVRAQREAMNDRPDTDFIVNPRWIATCNSGPLIAADGYATDVTDGTPNADRAHLSRAGSELMGTEEGALLAGVLAAATPELLSARFDQRFGRFSRF